MSRFSTAALMWPFATRGARDATFVESDLPAPLDFAAFATNDVAIKLWLPPKLLAPLDFISVQTDASRPDVLRRLMFELVYGRTVLEQLVVWEEEQARKPAEPSGYQHSTVGLLFNPVRRTASVQHLGKSDKDFKLWIPALLKQELEVLAKLDSLRLSDYIRKMLVRLLLGERAYVRWREVVGDPEC